MKGQSEKLKKTEIYIKNILIKKKREMQREIRNIVKGRERKGKYGKGCI